MSLRMRYRAIAALGAACGLTLAFTGNALAASTQWVNDNVAVGSNTSCASPGYNDIQSAVTAATAGDTIRVCAGSYSGQILVDKQLFLRGAKAGIDARTRSTTGESTVQGLNTDTVGFNLAANNIVLDGFRVRGVGSGPGIQTSSLFSGYTIQNTIIGNNAFGIYANTGSTSQNVIRTNLIKNNNANLGVAAAAGNGIYADQGTNRLLIARNTMSGQKNSGFLFTTTDPIENRDVTIQRNLAVNNATFVNLFGNNTNFQIRSNTTNDTNSADNASQGTAIRIADNANGVLVIANTIKNSPFSGVAVRDAEDTTAAPYNIDIQLNTITGAKGNGVDVTDSEQGAVSVYRNTVRHAVLDGIFFGPASGANLIDSNSSRFSGGFDCEDQSTGTGTSGTNNTWTHNVGDTSSPSGLCHPPV